eukprot:Nk52_evm49s1992 gene=Nk52_evmTU49s1992
MILLEFHNRIVEETLTQRFNSAKHEQVEINVCDFDGVTYHIHTPQAKNLLVISIRMPCFSELQEQGVDALIQREYGQYVIATEEDQSVSLQFDLDNLPADKDTWPRKVALLKRNCLAAPFEKYFKIQEEGGTSAKPSVVHYREDESVYFNAQKDRVTVVFSTLFKDDDDVIIGKVFLQEFVDSRRNLNQAPQVLFSHREPPRELEGTEAQTGDNIGYVTFVLFPRHYNKPELREGTINLIQTFRDYLHYHIKCSKAYLHSRMRARVGSMLKILNRARPQDPNVEKKTASGKTFIRR